MLIYELLKEIITNYYLYFIFLIILFLVSLFFRKGKKYPVFSKRLTISWGYKEVIIVYLCLVVLMAIRSFYYILFSSDLSKIISFFIFRFIDILFYLLIIWYILKYRNNTSILNLGLRKKDFSFKNIFFGIKGGLLAVLIIISFLLFKGSMYNLGYTIPSRSEEWFKELFNLIHNMPWAYLSLIISIVFISPVFEELLKGISYLGLRKEMGPIKAMFFVSLLFTALHPVSGFLFVGMFSVGIVFPYLYEKSKSLVAPIVAHMVYNGMMFLLGFLKL